ncbi:NUDIX hydrolase [Pseudoclavibacter soli]|uniref:NUDIX hydrolase n=1 Tax=Pseudoclavibacter soli TaxID=452623 RepID=UPI00040BA084|nr:NUDIX domain-containing protein [Pseudoclavibacter soli]
MTDRWLPDGAHMIPDNAELAFQGIIYDVYHWQQELYDGSFATFEMLRRPDTVVTIGLDDDDNVITINESQPGGITRNGGVSAGQVEASDASVLAGAKRELREETGYAFRNWRLLEVRQPESKIEWFVHVFVATGVIDVVPQRLDAGERISVHPLPFERYRDTTPYQHRRALERFSNAAELRAWVGEGEHPTLEV